MVIKYNDDNVSLDELKSRFNSYIQFPDYRVYAPFIHGTSKERAEEIKKQGLLTRNDCKDERIAQCNIWQDGLFENKSKDNLTYFAACTEVAGLPSQACQKAWETDHPHEYLSKLGRNYRDDVCGFVRLKNLEKYEDKLERDEDSKGVEVCLKAVYNDKELNKDNNYLRDESVPYSCLHVIERMPSKLIDFYDLGYTYGGTELAHEFIDATPKALHSIADWGTVAIRGSIPPEDIDIINYQEYIKNKNCRDDIENKRITAMTKCTENPYCLMNDYHNKESIAFFKNYVKSNVREYLKRLEIR